MQKKYLFATAIIIIIAAMLLFWGIQNQGGNQPVASKKVTVTTSFYPLYFFSQQIAQDKANVINITPSGAEPHDYEPTAQDLANIENSNMLVLIGPALEPWGDNIKQNIDQKTLVLSVGADLTTQKVVEDGNNIVDPHIWLAPPLAKQIVDKITQGFIQIDPANTEYYKNNSDALKLKLDNLDIKYKTTLTNCLQKNIITSHAAFGYLASAYRLNQVPISGLSPDAEPSAQQLASLAKFVKDNLVTYIFFESLVSPKLSQTIATETGAKTLELNPIEGLTPQELSQGQNYLTKMEENLTHLTLALQCK